MSIGLYRPTIHVITVTFFNVFFTFFDNRKKRDFTFFLLCFTRFLELR